MIFLATDLAIYKRLVGYPLDSKGRPLLDKQTNVPVNREVIGPPDLNLTENSYSAVTGEFTPIYPVLPSYGLRVPKRKSNVPNPVGLTSNDPQAVRQFLDGYEPNSFTQVPVFDENVTGRAWSNIWPCVTFRENSTEPEPGTFVYHDPFSALDPTSEPATITNAQGVVVETGFKSRKVRPHPESYNFQYVITVRSKNRMELGFLMEQVAQLFPQKGALTVAWQDGSTHTCDMLMQRIVTLDSLQDEVLNTQGSEEQRDFARAFVYTVEGYLDNTTNQFGVQGSYWATRNVPVVLQRLLEIDSIMGGLITPQPEVNMNDFELQPFTTDYSNI